MNEAPGVSREKLLSDMKSVIGDAEELLRTSAGQAGEKAEELRARLKENLIGLRDRLVESEHALVEKTRNAARATDDYVREHPWQALGIAAGAAFVIGLLIGRR